ncbi:hypothetical protein HAHE_17760 [Haloferula helveola]|uniref:Lipoprotein n=1 Tax=Haloferula helveola TaxID=490095 RepID=A0ABN6H2T9_9BACT|nr:hypothetical protein HAHE_17760 [Haloferula helveola]
MKKLFLLLSLAAVSLGFSSCCSMFGIKNFAAGSTEETYQVKTCGYDIVREEKVIDAKSGLVEVTETKVPRYKTKTKKVWAKCPSCTRYYCLKEGCCGSSTEAARKMATAQGASGSPHMGLIPTMKPIVP